MWKFLINMPDHIAIQDEAGVIVHVAVLRPQIAPAEATKPEGASPQSAPIVAGSPSVHRPGAR